MVAGVGAAHSVWLCPRYRHWRAPKIPVLLHDFFHLALADAGCRHLDATPAAFPSVLEGKRAVPDPMSGMVTPDARNGYYGCAWVFDTQSPWQPSHGLSR